MQRIFVVEDDPTIGNLVMRNLEGWGFEVRLAENFQMVLEEFLAFDPALVLLDISLPYYNGFRWCTEIRRRSNVPIIFLSSTADSMNQVMAINMGADDFVAKPFDLTLLVAKIQALLRRTYEFTAPPSQLERGELRLELASMTVYFGDESAELTRNEFRILQVLMERAGQIISREILMEKLWESDSFIDDNTLTVNLSRLRRTLDSIGAVNMIKTKKGEGYWVK